MTQADCSKTLPDFKSTPGPKRPQATSCRRASAGRPTAPYRICRQIAARVALDFGVAADDLTSATRGPPRIAFARQVAMYLAHVGLGLSFEAIGRAFGRDRTTVAHACRTIEDGRDDIWLDCRLATLELICRAEQRAEAGER